MDNYIFSIEMQVRDYELDAEGIVNNANYLHYLEHTRHQFCTQNGISFAELPRHIQARRNYGRQSGSELRMSVGRETRPGGYARRHIQGFPKITSKWKILSKNTNKH